MEFIIDLKSEKYRWYLKNSRCPTLLYIGKKQQEQISKEFDKSLLYANCDMVGPGKIIKYYGHEVIYVDEEDYLRLGA